MTILYHPNPAHIGGSRYSRQSRNCNRGLYLSNNNCFPVAGAPEPLQSVQAAHRGLRTNLFDEPNNSEGLSRNPSPQGWWSDWRGCLRGNSSWATSGEDSD